MDCLRESLKKTCPQELAFWSKVNLRLFREVENEEGQMVLKIYAVYRGGAAGPHPDPSRGRAPYSKPFPGVAEVKYSIRNP
jgi:hypothetical protein